MGNTPIETFRSAVCCKTFVVRRSCVNRFKAAKYEIQKPSLNLSRNIASLLVFVDVSRFSPCVINLSRSKNICCGLKMLLRKVERGSTLCNKFWLCCSFFIKLKTCRAKSRNKFAHALANQPISAPHFFNPQQMFLLRDKLITPGEKRETSTIHCSETMLRMLRDKLRVFVSRISPPLD